jgi:hypothetical protein
MTIPFAILWQVRIPLRKKLFLAGLFSFVFVTMIFAILRVTLINSFSRQPDPSWAYMWTSIEQNTGSHFRVSHYGEFPLTLSAIVVACLGSFRTLFVQDKPVVGPSYSIREASIKRFRHNKPKHPLEQSISMGDYSITDMADSGGPQSNITSSTNERKREYVRQPSQSSESPIVLRV